MPKYLKYEVLNEVQQALFVDRNSRQSGLTVSEDLNDRTLRRYVDTKHFISALSILREAELEDSKLADCSVFGGIDTYRDLLEQRSYLDYSSILESAVDVLVNDGGLRERRSSATRPESCFGSISNRSSTCFSRSRR